MTFEEAHQEMRKGKRVARASWTGTTKFIWLQPEYKVPASVFDSPYVTATAMSRKGVVTFAATVCRFWKSDDGFGCELSFQFSGDDRRATDWVIWEDPTEPEPRITMTLDEVRAIVRTMTVAGRAKMVDDIRAKRK